MKSSIYLILLFSFQLSVISAENYLHERVYLQTDKNLYLAGEPVLMKLMTVDSELLPLVFSKIAYVELVGDTIAKIQIMVEIKDGIGLGKMMLPADLPTGYYRLIAYTQYMRNEDSDVFFEKNIAVLNSFQSRNDNEETEQKNFAIDLFSMTEDNAGDVSVQTDKSKYTTRERGELIINGLPENIHTLSLTIAAKDFIPVNGSNISLFQKNKTNKSTNFSNEFLPEYEGHIITGKIIDNQSGQQLSKEAVLAPGISFPTVDGIRFFAGQQSENGDVRFFASNSAGTNEIATIVYHADDKYHIDVNSPFVSRFAPKPTPPLQIDSVYYEQLLERSVALQLFRYFSEATLKDNNIPGSYLKMTPSMSYPLDEYTRFTTMREVFIEFILGARFRKNAGKQEISVLTTKGGFYEYGSMPLVLLDGVPIANHEAIYNYDPLKVEQINIYSGPFLFGGYQFDGIVELITYSRLHADLDLTDALQVLTYDSPQLPYFFITPDYSEEKNRKSRMPDARNTLLWYPDVKTNSEKSIRLYFDTSDLTGEYQATVEGITKDGKHIFSNLFFNVR